MNFGTKLRTILRIAASLQTAFCVTAAVIADFNNKTLLLVWAIFTIACDFVVAFITTYFNNDYSPEGQAGTLRTREMKELANAKWEYVEEPEDAEVEDDDDE